MKLNMSSLKTFCRLNKMYDKLLGCCSSTILITDVIKIFGYIPGTCKSTDDFHVL